MPDTLSHEEQAAMELYGSKDFYKGFSQAVLNDAHLLTPKDRRKVSFNGYVKEVRARDAS